MADRHAYFFSDAHLGKNLPYDDARETRLLAFLGTLKDRPADVFILGDLFDFWIEYDTAIRPDYFKTICALSTLVANGCCVHYIAGNHDFALGPFLQEQVGINVHRRPLELRLQGRRFLLAHGDGLLPGQAAYRRLKRLLDHPLNQRIYKLLHPGAGIALATFCSRLSRCCGADSARAETLHAYRAWARLRWQQGIDVVMLGHTHHPELIVDGAHLYCNTGDWVRHDSYATLEDGQLRLWRYHPGSPPTQIAPRGIDQTPEGFTRRRMPRVATR